MVDRSHRKEQLEKPFGNGRTVSGVPLVNYGSARAYIDAELASLRQQGVQEGSIINRLSNDNPGFYKAVEHIVSIFDKCRPLFNSDHAKDIATLVYFIMEDAESNAVERDFREMQNLMELNRGARAQSLTLRQKLTEVYNVLTGKDHAIKDYEFQLLRAEKFIERLISRLDYLTEENKNYRAKIVAQNKELAKRQKVIPSITASKKIKRHDKPLTPKQQEELARRDALLEFRCGEEEGDKWFGHHSDFDKAFVRKSIK